MNGFRFGRTDVSSFLLNIIRKGAGLPQEALPRPSPIGVEHLPPDEDEDARALLSADADGTFEDEPEARVERKARARRPDSGARDSDESSSSESARASKPAHVARRKEVYEDEDETARDTTGGFQPARVESASPPTRAPDATALDASPEVPRAARERAPDARDTDFHARPAHTNPAPADESVAASVLDDTLTTEQRPSFPQTADESAFADEETEDARASFTYTDAARIVPRAPEPSGASIEPSSPGADAASHGAQAETPSVQVRIGTVEVRMSHPTPQRPAPTQSRAPRGFESYTAARRYLDRKWY